MLEQSLKPKRSVALVVLSVVVLAACICLFSAAISMLVVTWNPCSVFGGIVLMPLPAFLAIQQYRGTFRYDTEAALTASVLLFVVGGFAMVIVVNTFREVIADGAQVRWESLVVPILGTGAVVASAWANLSWSRCLNRSGISDEYRSERARFSMLELMVAVTAIACVTGLVTYFMRSIPPQFGENVSRDRAPFGLPAKATEISFCQGVRGTIAYEFTMAEKDFVEWVESGIGSHEAAAANVSLQPITVPYSIRRYNALMPSSTGADSITITNGLYYDWSKDDRGVHAAFDRDTNRVYYYAYFH